MLPTLQSFSSKPVQLSDRQTAARLSIDMVVRGYYTVPTHGAYVHVHMVSVATSTGQFTQLALCAPFFHTRRGIENDLYSTVLPAKNSALPVLPVLSPAITKLLSYI